MSEPFDPFSYDDEDNHPSETAKRKQNQQQQVRNNDGPARLEELPLQLSRTTSGNNRLPPRLNVKLSYHEEVSSSCVEENGKSVGGSSLSTLFVTGKIMAQVESTDSNQNAPFRLILSGSMAETAKVKCLAHCTPIDEIPEIKTYKVSLPKSLQPTQIATYTIENVQTPNMPLLLQTKATVQNHNTCRVSIQIRSNLSNLGDLHDFIIVLSIPQSLKMPTVKITRGDNGEIDEMKSIISWKIGHLGHGKSNLVSIEAEMDSSLSEIMEHKQQQQVEDIIDFPVLVRCSSGMDQISDVVISCGALAGEVPASVGVQIVKSFRLIHRVRRGNNYE